MLLPLLLSLLPLTLAQPSPPPARIYLHPPPLGLHSSPELTPSQAHAVLSFHLGIDRWVDVRPGAGGEWLDAFVRGDEGELVGGMSEGGGVVLLVKADWPEDFVAYGRPAFTIPSPPSYPTFQKLLNTYSSRLSSLSPSTAAFNASLPPSSPNLILDILSLSPSADTEAFKKGMDVLDAYVGWVDEGGRTGVSVDLGGLDGLGERDAEGYKAGVGLVEAALSVPALASHKYALIVLPSSSPSPPPSLLSSSSLAKTCHSTPQACLSSTSSCSSHGQCVATSRLGQTCYVCRCQRAPAVEGGQNVSWAGEMCEKVDISGSFTLLVGSTVFLIVVAVASVMLLYGVGTEILPNTLIGAAPSLNKRE